MTRTASTDTTVARKAALFLLPALFVALSVLTGSLVGSTFGSTPASAATHTVTTVATPAFLEVAGSSEGGNTR